jgi:hypothetical protein
LNLIDWYLDVHKGTVPIPGNEHQSILIGTFYSQGGRDGYFFIFILDFNWDKFPDCYRFDFSRAKLGLSAALHVCSRNRGTDTIGHVVFNRIKRLASMVLISDVFHSDKTYSSILSIILLDLQSPTFPDFLLSCGSFSESFSESLFPIGPGFKLLIPIGPPQLS